MPRRNGHASHVRDGRGVSSAYHQDIPEAEIDQRHRDALKAIRATSSAGVVDATRGWGTLQITGAYLPRFGK
jgi:allophanate hydrolase subunit 1